MTFPIWIADCNTILLFMLIPSVFPIDQVYQTVHKESLWTLILGKEGRATRPSPSRLVQQRTWQYVESIDFWCQIPNCCNATRFPISCMNRLIVSSDSFLASSASCNFTHRTLTNSISRRRVFPRDRLAHENKKMK